MVKTRYRIRASYADNPADGKTEEVASRTNEQSAKRSSKKESLPKAIFMTPKMKLAANQGNTVQFAAALKGGGAINAVTENKETALIIASVKGHYDLVYWLLNNGANVSAVDEDQRAALYYAAVNGHLEIAAMLLNKNADTNQLSKLHKTPLMAAVHNRYLKLSKLLLEAGSDANLQDHSGWSALFYAVWNGDKATTQLLLNAGADTTTRDKDGYTVADIAKAKKNSKILGLLAQ